LHGTVLMMFSLIQAGIDGSLIQVRGAARQASGGVA
jgi:hypothetical protein